MLIGVPKEIKVHEYRVGLTPGSVRELSAQGHQVLIESGAGAANGCGGANCFCAAAARGSALTPPEVEALTCGEGLDGLRLGV